MKKKKKQEVGFFSALFHMLIVGFLILCLGIVMDHHYDVTVPSPRTEDSAVNSLTSQEKIVDIYQMISTHDANMKAMHVKPKKINQKELICLAKNIFFEARGTDENEQIRVINVTTNRTHSSQFGGSYCDVVYDHAQFSWTLDLKKHNIARYVTEHKAWLLAQNMARYELQYGYVDITQGALFYHTPDVNPKWAHDGKNQQVVASNYHIYYRPY